MPIGKHDTKFDFKIDAFFSLFYSHATPLNTFM